MSVYMENETWYKIQDQSNLWKKKEVEWNYVLIFPLLGLLGKHTWKLCTSFEGQNESQKGN
jgi:hypothetical protein